MKPSYLLRVATVAAIALGASVVLAAAEALRILDDCKAPRAASAMGDEIQNAPRVRRR